MRPYDATRQIGDVFDLELLMAAIRFLYTIKTENGEDFSVKEAAGTKLIRPRDTGRKKEGPYSTGPPKILVRSN
jgi:hypothetical protein